MGMIRLKNVSKFYYSKGIIASGITRINLDLDVGEFVVITGESGSGKSTLLNVISGLDTYEEGEMYIEGKETCRDGLRRLPPEVYLEHLPEFQSGLQLYRLPERGTGHADRRKIFG